MNTIIIQRYDIWGEAWDFTVTQDGVIVKSITSVMHPHAASKVASDLLREFPETEQQYVNVDDANCPNFV